MANFFAELKRRHIYRVAAAYAVVAWLLLQIVNNIAPFMRLPDWAGGFFLVSLMIGFPIALIFAWVLELKSPDAPTRTGTSDWVLAAVAVAFMGMFAYQQFAPSRAPLTQQAGVEAARQAATRPAGISIAVLPFTNMSGDAGQEFFSDGITEEITSALAKVPDLRVVARTSAFQFKGKSADIEGIGKQLHATHLIEGSVRKAGDRVRITVQLIKSDDGTHVWAEDYDRQLTDVFAIQEDIARTVTASLNMSLGLKPGENLVRGTQNLGTYQEYLQAKAWYRDRASTRTGPFLKTLESVVARDPGFAPAWAALSLVYAQQSAADPVAVSGPIEAARRVIESNQSKAEAAARKAISLNPKDPDGYGALTFVQRQRGDWQAAIDSANQGLALDPNDPDVLGSYENVLARVGKIKEALRVQEQLRALDPLVPTYDIEDALLLHTNSQNKEAIALLEAIPENAGFFFRNVHLARAYAAEGRYADASDALHRLAAYTRPEMTKSLEAAAQILRSAPAVARDPRSLPGLGRAEGNLYFVYSYVGAHERFMDHPEREAELHFAVDFSKHIWAASAAPSRKTERFKTWARRMGLVDYWREHGWADVCHPTTGGDFECN